MKAIKMAWQRQIYAIHTHSVCFPCKLCAASVEVGNLHRFQNLAYAPNLNNVNHSWNWIGAQHNLEMKFPTCNMYTYKVRPTPPDFGRGTMCVVDGRSLWRSLYNRSWSSTNTTSTGEGKARRVLFKSLPLKGLSLQDWSYMCLQCTCSLLRIELGLHPAIREENPCH